jgi:Asp-tRNA(Asn)/Glu-tRNA(Gln) amidotransferase A subunit family amidase
MGENKLNKQELLELAKKLADKHAELKEVVINMLDEMDKIELEYNKIVEEIKKN